MPAGGRSATAAQLPHCGRYGQPSAKANANANAPKYSRHWNDKNQHSQSHGSESQYGQFAFDVAQAPKNTRER
jgi:hypothetical protein